MDKVLLKTVRLCCRHSIARCRQPLSRFFSESSEVINQNQGYKSLDQDTSWEAEILRHEKLLNRLKKEGVSPEDLPELEREEKVQVLPHLSFREKSKFEKDEAVIDETSKLMLGNLTKEKAFDPAKTLANIDQDFVREDVQKVLCRIHYTCDPGKVFKPHITKRKEMPSIRYLTDEQFREETREIQGDVIEKIRMPPVMLQRKQCSEIIAEDHVLDGYEESNVSFVDISEGLHNRERFIVMREPSGTLRKAEWEERDRLLQTYYPVPEREIIPPSFFEDQSLKNVFEHKLHENTLDRCSIQFEADSKQYIETFEAIYRDIDEQKLYNLLRSTRYFGGLVYFLAKNFSLDGLLLDMLKENRMENAADCVKLFTLLHPNCETNRRMQGLSQDDYTSIIEAYIDSDSKDKKFLSMALNSHKH